MIKITDKTALVTHKGCTDGSGCAMVFVLAGGLSKNIIFRGPKECSLTVEQAKDFDQVLFADVCPNDLSDPAGGKPWKVFDHHETNHRKHSDNAGCVFSSIRCGTSLFAEQLGLDIEFGSHSKLIRSIEAYDLGNFDNENGMFIATIASSKEQEDFYQLLLEEGDEIFSKKYLRSEFNALTGIMNHYSSRAVKSAKAFDFEGYWVAVVVSPNYWKNEIAMRILNGDKIDGRHVDFVAIADHTSGMISLRSKDVNVAKIAERFGGGGHAKAAAFRINTLAMHKTLFEEMFG